MRALALEYHDVIAEDAPDASGFPGSGPASYKISHAQFRRHLAEIEQCVVAPPDTTSRWLAERGNRRPLFMTFDDGGVSAHNHIAEALEQHGWRGHFFMTAGRIDSRGFLSRSQLRDLDSRGHVIGSHSQTHPARMGACSHAMIRDEWTRSVACLSDILGHAVDTASIPGGFYRRPVAELASEAGLRILFTSAPTTRCETVDSCLLVGRYTLRRWSSPSTAAALASGAWLPRAGQQVVYGGLNLARVALGDQYTRLRQWFWARER